jgi:hypothetical protein
VATTGSDQDLLEVGRSIGFGLIIVEVKLARPPAWANRRATFWTCAQNVPPPIAWPGGSALLIRDFGCGSGVEML